MIKKLTLNQKYYFTKFFRKNYFLKFHENSNLKYKGV